MTNIVGINFTSFFPKEISFSIFSYLKPTDLIICSLVSKEFQLLAEDNRVWKAIAEEKNIPFTLTGKTKAEVCGYCLVFTRLFKTIFPHLELPANKFDQYDAIKNDDVFKESIQSKLNDCLETASPEVVTMLIQAGGKIKENSPRGLIKKIMDYSARESNLHKRIRISSHVPLTVEDKQDLSRGLQILEIFVRAKGKIVNSKDLKSLLYISLKYQNYALSQLLLNLYMKNIIGNNSLDEFLSSLIKRDEPYRAEEVPHVKAIIETLLNRKVIFGQEVLRKFFELGIDLLSLNILDDSTQQS